MATGKDAPLIASSLVGLPYLIIARKEIRTVQELKGKTLGVGTGAGLPYQLLKAFVKKFSLEDMQIPAVYSWPQGTGPSPSTRRAHPEAIGRV
jgi:hypothetical protein